MISRLPCEPLTVLLLAAVCVAISCDNSPTAVRPDAAPISATAFRPDGAADAPNAVGDFERFQSLWGNLETLAGSGLVGHDSNNWLATFEGGLAKNAELSTPHFAMGDRADNVYIVDKEAHAVRKVTPDGHIFTVAGTNEAGDDGDAPGPATKRRLNRPNGLWVKADGTFFILDTDNKKVRRVSPAGELTTVISIPDLTLGRGLWVADDEKTAFIASERLLLRWTAAAGLETYADGFVKVANLVVDDAFDPIVTDHDANRVFRVGKDRRAVPMAGNGADKGGGDGAAGIDTGLSGVRAVWPVQSGGFLLGTQSGNQIWYLDRAGVIHLFVDGGKNAHGGDGELLSTPGKKVTQIRSVTTMPNGALLIVESDQGFVRIVRPRLKNPSKI